MTLFNAIVFPIKARSLNSMDQAGNYNFANLAAYQGAIGKLMYLAYNIWLDISFIVGLLS